MFRVKLRVRDRVRVRVRLGVRASLSIRVRKKLVIHISLGCMQNQLCVIYICSLNVNKNVSHIVFGV